MDPEQTPAPTGDATGQETPANGGQAEAPKTFTQADVDRLIKERLERQKTALDAAQAKAKAEAEAAALAEQGKWKEVAEGHAAKLAELESIAAKAARYEAALQAQLAEAMKGVPEHITPLLEKLDVAERLEYLAKNRAALVPATPPVPDTNAGGRGTGQPDPKAREAELMRRFPALNRR